MCGKKTRVWWHQRTPGTLDIIAPLLTGPCGAKTDLSTRSPMSLASNKKIWINAGMQPTEAMNPLSLLFGFQRCRVYNTLYADKNMMNDDSQIGRQLIIDSVHRGTHCSLPLPIIYCGCGVDPISCDNKPKPTRGNEYK